MADSAFLFFKIDSYDLFDLIGYTKGFSLRFWIDQKRQSSNVSL